MELVLYIKKERFKMSNTISNFDDVIDSRDVIARIEELRDKVEDEAAELSEFRKNEALHLALTTEEIEELSALEALQNEAEGYAPNWQYGAQLIRDSYFEQAMDEMIEDFYPELSKDLPSFVSLSIDYDALQMDYTAVEFDGVTYWVR